MVPRQQRMPATAKRDIMLAGLNFFIRAVVMARQAMNRMMEKIYELEAAASCIPGKTDMMYLIVHVHTAICTPT